MAENKKIIVGSNIRHPETLRILLNNMVDEIASGISLEEFEQTLSTLKDQPSVTRSLFEVQKTNLIDDFKEDINHMYDNQKIEDKYNAITKLVEDCSQDETYKAWRPTTGDCNSQLHSYEIKILQERKENLQKMVADERNIRELMEKKLLKKRNLLKLQQQQMITTLEKTKSISKSLEQTNGN